MRISTNIEIGLGMREGERRKSMNTKMTASSNPLNDNSSVILDTIYIDVIR